MMALKFDPSAVVQSIDIDDDTLKFKTPMCMCISGQSMSGKSEFMLKLLTFRKEMFDTEFDEIFYCEPEHLGLRHNPVFERIKQICPFAKLIQGLPDVAKLHLNLDRRPKLLLIDDLQESFLQSAEMLKLLSIDLHHFHISTVYTLHNFYAQAKYSRSLSLQTNYRVLFFNRLDLTEIRNISLKLCGQPRFLLECFEFLEQKFPEEKRPYILIDGHMGSPLKNLFIQSRIFPLPGKEIQPIFFTPD
ncbi:MAG: hypothetical protein FJ333_08295 [Sphingomonadales bacterium]|nr:hypothetical protein [Sphingomonadales bacterium]